MRASALGGWAIVLVVALLLTAPAAKAQEYRRRHQRERVQDATTPTSSYGSSARGLNRAGKRYRPPFRRQTAHGRLPKNDSGEVEAIESVADIDMDGTGDLDGPASWWGEAWPNWDRILDAYTPRPVRKHTANTIISHRSSYGLGQDPLFNAFGIDGFNNVGLGVRVGIIDQLDLGAMRWGNQLSHDTYEFDLRGQILAQKKHFFDLSLRGGYTWFAQQHANDAGGLFAQLLMGRLWAWRVWTGLNLLYHSSSSGPQKSNQDTHGSAALQVALDWRIAGGYALAAEVTPAIAGYHLRFPPLTFGPRFITNRHTFAIVLSNTQYWSSDAIVAGAERMNPKYWKLGFHITREL